MGQVVEVGIGVSGLNFRRESCEDVAKGLASLNQADSKSGRIPHDLAERPKTSDGHNGLAGARADHSLLQLQREYGNRYVQRVLALSRQAKDETVFFCSAVTGSR